MFYSHQLLARKAPLGQIWMAATMHAKINRRKLDKLNIINICEEILNPSVPMALRLSGILMGGVVIVYERKVKLLYDDVTRLLVEINEAWKIKPVADPTILPKGRLQANTQTQETAHVSIHTQEGVDVACKFEDANVHRLQVAVFEAVTLPDHEVMMMGTDDIEQSLHFSNTTTMRFHGNAGFIDMQLDHVDESFVNFGEARDEDLAQHHQADAANITLFETFNPYRAEPPLYNRFERFDIEGDEDTQTNFTPHEYTQIPTTIVPSPPPEEPQQAEEIRDQHPEHGGKQQSDECREEQQKKQKSDESSEEPQRKQQSDETKENQDAQMRSTKKRKTRRRAGQYAMDYEQTIIPGHVYQSWLQNPSDLASRRGRKRKHVRSTSTMKIAHLMELPPLALMCGLSRSGVADIHYPRALLKLWIRSTQPKATHDSPSGGTPQPPEPVASSVQDRVYPDPLEFPTEDFHSGVGSQPKQDSIEKQMANLDGIQFPTNDTNLMFTPGNSGDDNNRSIPSSGSSGDGFLPPEPEVQLPSGRSNIKRPYSSSRRSGSSLPPVAEENPWEMHEPNFKLRRLSEDGFSNEHDILIETGPTPTQHPLMNNHPIDNITDAIRQQLKMHFESSGGSKIEYLNQLTTGMDRKRAAQLFYQTCVLATHDLVRVQQKIAFGNILISRGSKM